MLDRPTLNLARSPACGFRKMFLHCCARQRTDWPHQIVLIPPLCDYKDANGIQPPGTFQPTFRSAKGRKNRETNNSSCNGFIDPAGGSERLKNAYPLLRTADSRWWIMDDIFR